MKPENLIEKYSSDQSLKNQIQKFLSENKNSLCDKNEKLGLKTGDIVTFWSGYNGDILYQTEITGFYHDGKALVLWDCYWSPVDLEARRFKKVPQLRFVKVTFENGDFFNTSMAAHLKDSDILEYYQVGKVFNLGSVKDNLSKVSKVEILS